MKTLSTKINSETMRKLEKAASSHGTTVTATFRFIAGIESTIHDLDTWDADDFMEMFYSMSKGTQANIRADARAHGMATLPYLRLVMPGVIRGEMLRSVKAA